MKKKYNSLLLTLLLCSVSFNSIFAQCVNGSSWGSATAPASGSVTISSCTYQTEYNTVSSVAATTTYTSSYSLGGCITVTSSAPGGTVVATGNSPLTWTSIAAGTYYLHYTTSCASTCGQASNCGTSTITFVSSGGGGGAVNDLCSGATPLIVNSNCVITNYSITPSYTNSGIADPACLASGSNTVVEDAWYSFSATNTATTIEVANSNRRMAFAVYSGNCGSLSIVDCQDAVSTTGTESATVTTVVGQTYYVRVIRTNGDGLTNTMNGTICIHSASGGGGGGAGSTCPDLGFENMASGANGVPVTGWTIYSARNNVSGPYTIEGPINTVNVINSPFNESADIRPGSDPAGSFCYFGSIPVPNGSSNVIRLGAYQQAGSDAVGMETTFVVSQPYLAYHYILGFESTGHTVNNRGFAYFRLKDASNNVLPCGSFEVYENGPGESWTFDNSLNDVWLMDNWVSKTIDLNGYIGQTLTIEVWVADCQEGAHSGFGYFDFECLASATPDCSAGGVLPVNISDVDLSCEDNNVMLDWTTLSEENNSHFVIQRSTDGFLWSPAGELEGQGFSNKPSDYTFVDEQPLYGISYYRIVQVDYNGETEMSRVKSIDNRTCVSANNGVSVYPNPATDDITISGEGLEKVKVFNAVGQLLAHFDNDDNQITINMSEFAEGMYLIHYELSNGAASTKKIIIRR